MKTNTMGVSLYLPQEEANPVKLDGSSNGYEILCIKFLRTALRATVPWIEAPLVKKLPWLS